jgi:hypothetical protein
MRRSLRLFPLSLQGEGRGEGKSGDAVPYLPALRAGPFLSLKGEEQRGPP